ncbi:hypothetical protein D9758_006318 [Tetrapyrgos nigripes]|uniref:Initiator tRNA phosphoribosyl transferase n=1 Tax=Tetrapyrgos nigripes TaxID=182062 RepID=A0A8H5D908_9AGAR|nr:hypothetical protein D9758_006318 [Tetrapyrgos nigripes]
MFCIPMYSTVILDSFGHVHHFMSTLPLDIDKTHLRSHVLTHIRKETLDLYNRLHSIEEDIQFVNQVHGAYPRLPLIPNLRCGAWYTDPAITGNQTGAYFKSTDGHTSNWSFNLRRPNLHLLPVVLAHGGIVLVDSTRSGKRMPDALSKTAPIWCAVVNRAFLLRFPKADATAWDTALYTPPAVVSKSEHDQIEELLDSWAQNLNESSYTLPELPRPLRPIWITPSTSKFPNFSNDSQSFIPIICASASQCIESGVDRRTGGFVYIQGSGDDHELWGVGLTPKIFWQHREAILSADRSEVMKVAATFVKDAGKQETRKPSEIRKVGARILVCSVSDLPAPEAIKDKTAWVMITSDQETVIEESPRILPLLTSEGKKGQAHFLQHILPRSLAFIGNQLSQGMKVYVACEDGKDLSVGVAVVALQQYFDENGNFIGTNAQVIPDKKTIRKRLEWVINDRPEANPTRTTLKRVNEFLMSPASFRSSTT